MNIISKLLNPLFYIFKLVGVEIKKLRFVTTAAPNDKPTTTVKEKISRQDIISDFVEVFRPTRIFFVFNILAFVIFLLLPQGKDVMLIVIEDLSNFQFGSLLSLLFGVTVWSVIAEFGARYKIYVTDNSGKSLTGNRVSYRKQLQKFFSMVYLLLPFTLVFIGVSVVTINSAGLFRDDNQWNWPVIAPYAVVIISLIITASGLSRFYLDAKWIKKFSKRDSWLTRFLKLPKDEQRWVEKLYGIYNDYVFTIRKESFFIEKEFDNGLKDSYTKYVEIAKKFDPEEFPDNFIRKDEQAPVDFRPPVHYSNEYKPDFRNPNKYRFAENPAGSYRWIYSNNPAFYKTLHKQVTFISLFSLAAIILVSLISSEWIGSPGLVCLSFACWQGLYTGLVFIDYRYKKFFPLSARWLLVFWFFIVSAINNDHPIRYNEEGKLCDTRTTLTQHFERWLDRYRKMDTSNMAYISIKDTAKPDSLKYFPVIFITAEGGALRTGAFTAMLLAALQDSFPEFRNNIFAYSTVSGGTVGVSFFNAINYLERDSAAAMRDSDYYLNVTRRFFLNDQLSPVLSKSFYGDVLNYLWPYQFQHFDRAIALEKAWEKDYSGIFNKINDRNIYSSNFLSCYKDSLIPPAWFINTTEVESGMQCFITNVIPDSLLFSHERDLLASKIRSGINYSTAVGLSTRFPFVSPSAAVKQDDEKTYHYVDGGYVENTGSKTMLEVLQRLRVQLHKNHIIPYVIQLKFGEEDKFSGTGFLNEIASVFSGFMHTRSANSSIYSSLLETFAHDSLKGRFITVPLEMNLNKVPMSWVLSERSMENLDTAVAEIMNDKSNELHKKLYLFRMDSTIILHPGKKVK